MAIATGPTATANSGAAAASQTITIPAVGAGDVFIVSVAAFLSGTTKPTVTLTSTGTAPVQIGTAQNIDNGTSSLVGSFWRVTATATDAGKVLTAAATINSFFTIALADYTGVNGASPVDVSGFATPVTGTSTVTCPTETTTLGGDWAIFATACGLPTTGLTGPAGSTQRAQLVPGATLIGAAIYDSNGIVSGSIGGGVFTAGGTGTWWSAMTLALAATPVTFSPVTAQPADESRRYSVKHRMLGLL